MSKTSFESSDYKVYDFRKIWKYFPIKRYQKETVKRIIFGTFSFAFQNWASYHNWKKAQLFVPKNGHLLKVWYWKQLFSNNYTINISKPLNIHKEKTKTDRLAIVIHAFYLDIFDEIIDYLKKSDFDNISLYITTNIKLINTIEEKLIVTGYSYIIMVVENHGRDILPFLKILPKVISDGHEVILKLHTKGSNHLNKKIPWRYDLFNKLIGDNSINKSLLTFNQNPNIGMIGPAGHIIPMHFYYGSNAHSVEILSNKMGVQNDQLMGLNFAAGSMFYVKTECLLPILKLNLEDEMFEMEANSTDGTLAHAVERIFAVGLIAKNKELADTNYDNAIPILRVCKNHSFTQ